MGFWGGRGLGDVVLEARGGRFGEGGTGFGVTGVRFGDRLGFGGTGVGFWGMCGFWEHEGAGFGVRAGFGGTCWVFGAQGCRFGGNWMGFGDMEWVLGAQGQVLGTQWDRLRGNRGGFLGVGTGTGVAFGGGSASPPCPQTPGCGRCAWGTCAGCGTRWWPRSPRSSSSAPACCPCWCPAPAPAPPSSPAPSSSAWVSAVGPPPGDLPLPKFPLCPPLNPLPRSPAHFHHVIEQLRFRQGSVGSIFMSAGTAGGGSGGGNPSPCPPPTPSPFPCSFPVLLHRPLWRLHGLHLPQDR